MPDPKLQIILAAKDITGKALTKFQGRIAAITKSVFSFRGALGALTGAGGFGILITKSLEAADSIAKTADKLGLSTTALQEFRYAAERSGVATKTLDMAMQRFTRRVAEAAQEKGELRGILEQYNIAVRDAAGNTRATVDVFRDLANVIQRTQDPAERLRIAFKAFDSEGAALVNMLSDGTDGLDAFAKKAGELGVILEDDLIQGSVKAKDAMDDLGKVIQVNFSRVVLENVESITAAVESLATAMSQVAKYAGLRSISNTFSEGLRLAKEGLIDYQTFWKAGFLERQKMVDEAMGGAQVMPDGRTIVRQKIFNQPAGGRPTGAAATVRPAIGLPAAPAPAPGTASYDQTWGPGELSRFAQYDVLVRDSQKAYEDMTGHVKEYTDYTAEAYQSIDSRVSTSFSHASDAIAGFATEGKAAFKGFAESLISDLIRIQSRMLLSGLFGKLGGVAGLFGGGPAGPIHVSTIGGATTAFGMASGGYLGEGVVGIGKRSGSSYEFHPNEVVLPADKMGGGSTRVVINNYSGQPGTVSERQDVNGGKTFMVMIGNDVLNGGPTDQAIRMRYGLRPAGKLT